MVYSSISIECGIMYLCVTAELCQVFLFCVPNLVGICIDYLANLKNLLANLLGNLEIVQGDLQISFEIPTTFLTSCKHFPNYLLKCP